MQVLYLFESIRNPVLDYIMLALTELGNETAFLAIALVLFWCVDKNTGYYMISTGFIGTLCNQVMKLSCRVPRPWVKDPNFTIVEAAREAAAGYSFPSGHSQTAVGTFGAIALTTRQKWLRRVSIFIAVMVPITRMYLGVHTPADVIVGSGMAIAILLLLKPIFFGKHTKYIPYVYWGMILMSLAFVAYVELASFPADIDPHNLESAMKNAYTLLGSIGGMILVYYYDRKHPFDTKAALPVQFAKAALGLGLALGVKSGLKAPLEALIHNLYIARGIRYFLLVAIVGILWPMAFPFLSKLGRKASK